DASTESGCRQPRLRTAPDPVTQGLEVEGCRIRLAERLGEADEVGEVDAVGAHGVRRVAALVCERGEVGLDGGAQLHGAMVAPAASISTHRAARGTRSAVMGPLRAIADSGG